MAWQTYRLTEENLADVAKATGKTKKELRALLEEATSKDELVMVTVGGLTRW